MQNEITKLIQAIKADYIKFATRNGSRPLEGYFADSVANFDDSITIKEGKKYIKIIRENGVWGFIAKEDFVSKGKVFNKGDILKAAGWATPALNAARGNIFENYSVAWTGPHYLK